MVRHESMAHNNRRDNSSCIIPKDRPVHVRSIRPLLDHLLVYHSNAETAFAAHEVRNENERGT